MSDQSPQDLTIGIDLGTSAVKVIALGFDGKVIAEGSSAFLTNCALPHQAEQEPVDWLRAAANATRQMLRTLARRFGTDPIDRVRAIGLTGQLPTLVCMGDAGPLAPAVTWKDGRADAWALQKVDSTRRKHIYARTGMPIDGRYLAPMLRFHFADRINEIRCVLSAKDYLLAQLTGVRMTEPSTAAGYGIYDLKQRAFGDELRQFWDIPANLLPPVRAANSLAGPLSAAGAELLGLRAGIPVSAGAADSVSAAFAMGGLEQNVVSISFGSSAVILGAVAEPRLDVRSRYLLTPHVEEGWYGREMDLLATGTGYRWLSELFAWQDGEIDQYAADSIPGARGLSFAPYLAGGEQGALWNPKLRGAIFGLRLDHSRSDIARAFLEGVFFEIRRCIEVLAETSPVDSVMICGNIVRSASSLQILADILQRTVGTVLEQSPAAIGAALKARQIIDAPRNDPGDHSGTLRSASTIRPQSSIYGALYEDYLANASLCG